MNKLELLQFLFDNDKEFREFTIKKTKELVLSLESLVDNDSCNVPGATAEEVNSISHKEAITTVLRAAGLEGLTLSEIMRGLSKLGHSINNRTLKTCLYEFKKENYLIGSGSRGKTKYFLHKKG